MSDGNGRIKRGINDVLTVVEGFSGMLDEDNDLTAIGLQGIKSSLKVNFKCDECGRKWSATITSQVKRMGPGQYVARGCPHYNTVKRNPNEVPLCSEVESVYKFWDDSNTIDPTKTRANSSFTAHFKCNNCGYKWERVIFSQSSGQGKCPCCELNVVVEKGINDVFTLVPEAKENYDFQKNEGIDIYSLHIRDSTIPLHWKCPDCGRERQASLLSCIMGTRGSYTFRRCNKCVNAANPKLNAIASHPKYVKCWDYELNKDIDINLTSVNDKRTAHWKCKKCGYQWTSAICFYGKGRGCPKCIRAPAVKKEKKANVLVLCPEIESIYDFETNEQNGIDIHSLGASSSVVAHFKCKKCLYKWVSPIYARTNRSSKPYRLVDCPKCSNGAYRSTPYSEQFPDLAKMYLEELNDIPLDRIRGRYAVKKNKYNWLCLNCGKTFESTLDSMIGSYKHRTRGCPYCTNQKICEETCFANIHPDLMEEYAPDNTENPYENFVSSRKKVKWICKTCGYMWYSTFYERHQGGGKCPVCNRSSVIADVNSFAAVYPEFIQYWGRSNEKSAKEVFYNPYGRFNFLCSTCGAEFSSSVEGFVTGKNHNCPYCSNRKVPPDLNLLTVLYPDIARRWSSKNNKDPETVSPSKVNSKLWICDTCQGEYSASIKDVVDGIDECPYCKGKKLLKGFNSFADKHSDLANELDPIDNYLLPLAPNEVLDNSTAKFCWTCKRDSSHKYFMSPKVRLIFEKRGREPCLYCKGRRRKLKHFVLPNFK